MPIRISVALLSSLSIPSLLCLLLFVSIDCLASLTHGLRQETSERAWLESRNAQIEAGAASSRKRKWDVVAQDAWQGGEKERCAGVTEERRKLDAKARNRLVEAFASGPRNLLDKDLDPRLHAEVSVFLDKRRKLDRQHEIADVKKELFKAGRGVDLTNMLYYVDQQVPDNMRAQMRAIGQTHSMQLARNIWSSSLVITSDLGNASVYASLGACLFGIPLGTPSLIASHGKSSPFIQFKSKMHQKTKRWIWISPKFVSQHRDIAELIRYAVRHTRSSWAILDSEASFIRKHLQCTAKDTRGSSIMHTLALVRLCEKSTEGNGRRGDG